MREQYATSFQTTNYCAAFRHGVLIIVRLKDGQSVQLSLADTNQFRIDVFDYELTDDERDPVDRACAKHVAKLRKRKWITAQLSGAIITWHNALVIGDRRDENKLQARLSKEKP